MLVDGIVARHVPLLQEIGGVALTFGEDVHKEFRAGHLEFLFAEDFSSKPAAYRTVSAP